MNDTFLVNLIIHFLTGFITAMLLLGLAVVLAPRLGLMDVPDPRKVHARPVPRAGGICLWISMGCCWIYILGMGIVPISLDRPGVISLGGFLLLVLIGVLDDLFTIPWQPRLLSHFLVAGATLWENGVFHNPLVGAVALFFMVGIINAFNMIDNMDWQCGGVAMLILLAGLVMIFNRQGSLMEVPETLAFTLLGPLAAFLWWNRPVARIFLGDAGSIPLGFLLSWLMLIILTPACAASPWKLVAGPAFFLVPLYDLTTVVSIRLSQGKSPFHPDKQHLSHRMVRSGATPLGAVMRILMIQAAGVIGGIMVMLSWDPLVPKVVLVWLVGSVLALAWLDYKAFRKPVSV